MEPVHDLAALRAHYRHFIRYGLRAVQYKPPQRYVVVNMIRSRFRNPPVPLPTAQQLDNTREFVTAAAKYTGLESRILHNMVHVEWARQRLQPKILAAAAAKRSSKRREHEQFNDVYGTYDGVVRGLNETMDLCL